MRTIKFRGQDIENEGSWRYGSLIQYPNGESVIIEFDNDWEDYSYGVLPETVGQFTDLRDSNEREAYEGDIVEFAPYISVEHGSRMAYAGYTLLGVITVNEYRQWTLKIVRTHPDCRSEVGSLSHIDGLIKGAIIGNIHDNPELLKGK